MVDTVWRETAIPILYQAQGRCSVSILSRNLQIHSLSCYHCFWLGLTKELWGPQKDDVIRLGNGRANIDI